MRRLPPLAALRAFEAAARHLHFARAAEELHLTPTAISHQVRQLEDTLNLKLFHRYPRPIRLTDAGEALYPVLCEGFDNMADVIGRITQEQADHALTISVTVAFASRWLLKRLPDLFEQTGLRLAVEADDSPVDLSGSGVDFAVRYADHPLASHVSYPLFDDQLIPVCAPELLRDHGTISSDSDVLRLPLVQYRWSGGSKAAPDWKRWAEMARLAPVAIDISQHFSEEIHAIDAALSGQGVVLASSILAGDDIASGKLMAVSETALPGRTFWAVSRPDHPRKPDIEKFVAWVSRSEVWPAS